MTLPPDWTAAATAAAFFDARDCNLLPAALIGVKFLRVGSSLFSILAFDRVERLAAPMTSDFFIESDVYSRTTERRTLTRGGFMKRPEGRMDVLVDS